jgi:hypothetical protein
MFEPKATAPHPDSTNRVILAVYRSLPAYIGGLNRSMQHFILEGKDGVRNGTKIS